MVSTRTILPAGDLVAWKKLAGGIVCELKIPADAKRVGGLIGRKCRAEYALVVANGGESMRGNLTYEVGKRVDPDKFDDNPLVECSSGIHFFITKLEAEEYEN